MPRPTAPPRMQAPAILTGAEALLRSTACLWIALSLGACSTIQKSGGASGTTSSTHDRQARLAKALAEAEDATESGLESAETRDAYNRAVERAVELWAGLSTAASRRQPITCTHAGRTFVLRPAFSEKLVFDELVSNRTVKSKAAKRRIVHEGIGTPFVAWWKATPERRAREPFMSEVGYVLTVTATLDFRTLRGGDRVAALVLHDPRTTRSIRMAGREQPLATDMTATLEFIAAMDDAGMSGIGALMRSDKNLDKLGLFTLQPPAADRVPVIFVHGLMSRPATWLNVINELGQDPAVSTRFQPYFFRYPSGVPVLYSAARLREDLRRLHDELVRIGNPYARRMMLIGHSMGGLVSKSQIQGSGDRLWVLLFGDKPDKLQLTKEERDDLGRYLEFKPTPYVSRVIFVATPHRGSPLARRESILGKIAGRLVKLPGNVLGRTFDILQGKASSNRTVRELLAKGVPTSVDNLSDTSQFVAVSISMPLRPGVHLHSIIGNKEHKAVSDPECSDGVVPYKSSHLDGVESELIVPSGHGAHENPEALKEMTRILRLHVRQL